MLRRLQILRDNLDRYKNDGVVARKVPVDAEALQLSDSDSDDDSSSSTGAVRRRRLLRKDPGADSTDPVLSTLSVNKDLG